MYGTRDAAAHREATYTKILIKHGWTPGLPSPCVCSHPNGSRLVVHGDDFTFLGTDAQLGEAQTMAQLEFDVKIVAGQVQTGTTTTAYAS